MRYLFVCEKARLRSRTAADVMAGDGRSTRYAGVAETADRPLTADDIAWADRIFVFQESNFRVMVDRFDDLLADKPVYILGVPDIYEYMDPGLVRTIRFEVGLTEY